MNEPSLGQVHPWSGWWLAEDNVIQTCGEWWFVEGNHPLEVVQASGWWWFAEGNPLGMVLALGEENPLRVVQARGGGRWFAEGNHPLGVAQASGGWWFAEGNPLGVVQACGEEQGGRLGRRRV